MYGCEHVCCGVVKSHFQEGCNLVEEPWDFQGWYRAFALITLEMSQGSKCYVIEQQYMLSGLLGGWDSTMCMCVEHMGKQRCHVTTLSCPSIVAPSFPIGCVHYTSLIALPYCLQYSPEGDAIVCWLTSWNKAIFCGILVTHLLHPSRGIKTVYFSHAIGDRRMHVHITIYPS